MPAELDGVYARIYHCISKIPKGHVATYGQIAKLINASGARQVGYALSSSPQDMDIPWHRVINAKGEISERTGSDGDSEQRQRLLAEAVVPNKQGRIDLLKYRWQPTFEQLLMDEDELFDEQQWLDRPGFG